MSDRTCSIDGCEKPKAGRGLCGMHRLRAKRAGTLHLHARVRSASPQEAFTKQTRREGDCLVWTGTCTPKGYGTIAVNGEHVRAHRYAWEQANGPIPDGMLIDHICHNRACVEVKHLRLATASQNAWHRKGAVTGSKTGVLNVFFKHGRYQVVVKRYGKAHYGGTHATLEEAEIVAREMRAQLFGEFS